MRTGADTPGIGDERGSHPQRHVLQAGVPELDYPRAIFPRNVRFVGNWPAGPTTALPEWAADLDGDPTRRHSTLGYLSPIDFEREADVA